MYKWQTTNTLTHRGTSDINRCLEGITASLRAFHICASRAAENAPTKGIDARSLAASPPPTRTQAAAKAANEAASLPSTRTSNGRFTITRYEPRSPFTPPTRGAPRPSISRLQLGVGRGGTRGRGGSSRGSVNTRGRGGARGGARGRGRGGARGRGRRGGATNRDPNSKFLDAMPYEGEPWTGREKIELARVLGGEILPYVPSTRDALRREMRRTQRTHFVAEPNAREVRMEGQVRVGDREGKVRVERVVGRLMGEFAVGKRQGERRVRRGGYKVLNERRAREREERRVREEREMREAREEGMRRLREEE